MFLVSVFVDGLQVESIGMWFCRSVTVSHRRSSSAVCVAGIAGNGKRGCWRQWAKTILKNAEIVLSGCACVASYCGRLGFGVRVIGCVAAFRAFAWR